MATWIECVWQDVRYACRMLGHAPGFTVVAVLSLAVGIGANCAVFSLADALLLRPLPIARPSEVYTVGSATAIEAFGISGLASSYRDYVDLRDRSRSFQGLAAFSYVTAGFATRPGAATSLEMGMLSSGNLLRTMGVQPVVGRDFLPDEDRVPGRDAVVILGHGLWEQRFGGDTSVVGRRVDIDGHPFTVIGVAPASFSGMDQFVRVGFFVPLMMSPQILTDPKAASLEARDARNLTLKGRLAPGMSQAMAQAEVERIGADLERAYPDTNRNRRWGVRSELQTRAAQSPPDAMLVAMLATLAAAVLMVACANVAGLLTSRAPLRAREMAMRLAIGAGRARLVRQLITESLLTALLGGVAGLGLGYAGITLFRQIELPSDLPIQLTLQMDGRALVFGLAVSLASALLSGVLPAIQASRADLTAVMKAGDVVTAGRRRRWGRAVLVSGQVALAVVLLTVSLFTYRGFAAQLAAGPGYRTDHLLLMGFDTSLVRYTDAQSSRFFKEVADRAREVPGVVRVSMTSAAPMSNDVGVEPLVPEGYQLPTGKESASVLSFRIDEHYFDAMALPLLRGRHFTVDDAADAPKVAIVNEQFAQHYWPNQDPIGKRFRQVRDQSWVEVVGVAKMSKYLFILEPPTEFVYLPYRQGGARAMVMLVQTSGDPARLAGPLRDVARSLDANLPIYNVRTMSALYRMRATSIFHVILTTVAGMGLMGLGLAVVGLYSLVSYAAGRRTREIGIRMAIGADGRLVLRMVLGQGLRLAAVGLAVGLVASEAAGRLLIAAFPTGSVRRDSGALLIVVPLVLAVTFLAAYIPARRAARTSPMQALRND